MGLIDKSKKSNMKCEHCGNYVEPNGNPYKDCKCSLTGQPKNYWNRCKQFVWRKDRAYVQDGKRG